MTLEVRSANGQVKRYEDSEFISVTDYSKILGVTKALVVGAGNDGAINIKTEPTGPRRTGFNAGDFPSLLHGFAKRTYVQPSSGGPIGSPKFKWAQSENVETSNNSVVVHPPSGSTVIFLFDMAQQKSA